MDPPRILLLVAVGVFVAFLLVKMQPRLDEDETREELEPLQSRAERRIYRGLKRLSRAGLLRIAARVELLLDRADNDGLSSLPADSVPGESLPGDSLAGDEDD
jgi:hypothetical protein